MAEERKKHLKENIINRIKDILDNSDASLEELEDGLSMLENIEMDDLTSLQEKLNDK